jgi:Protein of unknown function (DUF3168)
MTISASLAVQQAAVEALRRSPPIMAELSGIYDGPPPRAAFPYVSIGDGLNTDWSTKTETGREIRLALTVWDDGEAPARLHALMQQVEEAVSGIERDLDGWRIASVVFVRALVARNPAGPWAGLIEHRVRVIQP